MHQGFRVAVGGETMATADKLVAKLPVVVNFAIKHHPNRTVLIGHRLVACAQVDDAQPSHADTAGAVRVEAFVVRTAMANQIGHRLNAFRMGFPFPEQESSYSAHVFRIVSPSAIPR